MPDTPPSPRRDDPPSLWLAIRLAWDLGFIIAVPAALFGFSGAYLDKIWGTSPLLLLVGFILAVILSAIGVRRRITDILLKK
ncbi:MAG: AtpZ/AtpI family protein [Candidatus Peregrinibacteria bacterium]